MGEEIHKLRKQQRRGSKKKQSSVKQKNRIKEGKSCEREAKKTESKRVNLMTKASITFNNTIVNE